MNHSLDGGKDKESSLHIVSNSLVQLRTILEIKMNRKGELFFSLEFQVQKAGLKSYQNIQRKVFLKKSNFFEPEGKWSTEWRYQHVKWSYQFRQGLSNLLLCCIPEFIVDVTNATMNFQFDLLCATPASSDHHLWSGFFYSCKWIAWKEDWIQNYSGSWYMYLRISMSALRFISGAVAVRSPLSEYLIPLWEMADYHHLLWVKLRPTRFPTHWALKPMHSMLRNNIQWNMAEVYVISVIWGNGYLSQSSFIFSF